jgi:hypothetical protein
LISKIDLRHFVVETRARGVKPVTCNTWLRALNAACRWLHEQGELPAPVKLKPQRIEKRIIRTHDDTALRGILSYQPTSKSGIAAERFRAGVVGGMFPAHGQSPG